MKQLEPFPDSPNDRPYSVLCAYNFFSDNEVTRHLLGKKLDMLT